METELIDSFERFRTAVALHNTLQDAADPDPIAVMASADAILRARLGFFRCLLNAGWTAPDEIRDQMSADRRLLREDDDRRLLDPGQGLTEGRAQPLTRSYGGKVENRPIRDGL